MTDTFEPLGDVAASVVAKVDPYWYWAAKLRGEDPDPIEPRTDMPLGFFRLRSGDPLAVWISETGERIARRGFSGAEKFMPQRHMEAMAESGSFGTAVTEEAYRAAFDAGSWPDDPPPLAGVGHNQPADPFEAARLEFDGEVETTAAFLARPVETQADADMCSTWARRVGLLAKLADEAHEAEKAPHLLAGREVDDKWRPIRVGAKELTTRLKEHVEPFLKRQKREAEAIAAKAREEADRLRREAADADRKSEAERADLIRQAQDAERRAEPKRVIAGRPNMRVSLRKEKRARIVDYAACYAALAGHPDMKALVEQLANRAVKAGIPLAGVEVEEYERAA